MNASDWINTFVALGTWAAVVVLVVLYLSQQRNKKRAERTTRINALIAYHSHFYICLRRIREYWENMALEDIVSSFRLVEIPYDRALSIAPDLFSVSEDVSVFLKAIEEHVHLNMKWNDAFNASLKSDEYTNPDTEDYKYYAEVADNAFQRLNAAVPVVYKLTYDILNRIEKQSEQLCKKTELKLRGSIKSEPDHLDPLL